MNWLRQLGEQKDGLEVLGLWTVGIWFLVSTLSYQWSPAAEISIDASYLTVGPRERVLVARTTLENKGAPIEIKKKQVTAEFISAPRQTSAPKGPPSSGIPLACGSDAFDPLQSTSTLVPSEKLSFACSAPLNESAGACALVTVRIDAQRHLLGLSWARSSFLASAIACDVEPLPTHD